MKQTWIVPFLMGIVFNATADAAEMPPPTRTVSDVGVRYPAVMLAVGLNDSRVCTWDSGRLSNSVDGRFWTPLRAVANGIYWTDNFV